MLSKIVGLLALVAVCSAQKVPIDVYYESLCPDSQAFITEQLYPTVTGPNNLEKFLKVNLVPYGKSTHKTLGSDVIFTCHHGPNECYGNKIQSCAIKLIQVSSYQKEHTRESLTLEYINCLMKTTHNFADDIYPGAKCGRELKLDNWELIEQCANSTDGSKYLQKNGETTAAFQSPLISVPTIVYNESYDKDFQDEANSNFRAAICKRLVPRPQECVAADNGATEKTSVAFILTGMAFFLSSLF